MEKILNFIKLRLTEISGLIVITAGIFIFYSLITYSASNPTIIFPEDADSRTLLIKYGSNFADFVLQAFGLISFGLSINFIAWGGKLVIEKKITNFWFQLSFIVFYLISGSLFFKIFQDQSFWLPDNGNGGFLGSYILGLLSPFKQHFVIINYLALCFSIVFFVLSLGLSVSKWKNIFTNIFKPLTFLLGYIGKQKSKIKDQEIENIEINNPVFKEEENIIQELQPSLPLQESSKPKSFEYRLPSLTFLKDPDNKTSDTELSDSFEKQSKFLEDTLLDFGIMGKIKRVSAGPVVTLYEFEPAAGIKTSKIINLSDDIARSTSSIATRVATVPGKNTIGIEIPNKNIEPVYLKEILSSKEFSNKNIRLPITLGKSISGYPIVGDLVSMPHLLIAGTTGSGKSVCINTLILSLLYRHKPEYCKLILIDPKMLELSIYQGIPHLLSPVITEPKKATAALKWVVGEMENRYRRMTEEGVRNISGYNEKMGEDPKKIIPYIVVIVDEMADLMMIAGKEIENYIQRLAQMARAAGIHIVMATQRPSVDVITGTIKANFPTRISFQVTSKIDSRTILGEQGAELLLGKGDMLFMSSASRVIRIHGPFVSDEEIEKITTFLRSQGTPDYLDEVTKIQEQNDENGNYQNNNEKDELFDEAVRLIKMEGKASTSYLQRKLQIGYNRAARIIDQMEEAKIISPANHAGKRDIFPS
ncbi:MAG: DNA translocase FtsK 4TM domain-containing protein [Pelagibacteraceae bacterium]